MCVLLRNYMTRPLTGSTITWIVPPADMDGVGNRGSCHAAPLKWPKPSTGHCPALGIVKLRRPYIARLADSFAMAEFRAPGHAARK
jgi:hypothetical protein